MKNLILLIFISLSCFANENINNELYNKADLVLRVKSLPRAMGSKYLWNKVNTLVDDLAPAGSVQYYRSANNYSWSPIDGRFTLNKSWVYQSCTAPAQWPLGTRTQNNSS